jgi:hypothetical protein
MTKRRRAGAAQIGEVKSDETVERANTATAPTNGAQADAQAGALFGPGEAAPGVRGLAGRDGTPRQWAYGASYNLAQRPRGTEQTSFEQLRNLAALYDGIQLCEQALMRALIYAQTSRPQPPASGEPASHGNLATARTAA